MLTLLETYSLSQILIFLVILILAIKECWNLFDWAKEKLHTYTKAESVKDEKEEKVKQLTEKTEQLQAMINTLTEKVDFLLVSDKDDIKSFLTREHHYFCYQVGWIDDYSLECCERRFQHYKDEGGNSFIEGFMEDLRKLPKQPPKEGG